MRILKEDTLAVMIDMQEKLVPVMSQSKMLLQRSNILIQGLNALNVPILITEQYPKGLGTTVPELNDLFKTRDTIEKTSFSALGSNKFLTKLNWLNKDNVIVFGIESHICVLQTVLDLIALGKTPILIKDCISSRNIDDMEIAINRMRNEGAIISSSESILFELCQKAGNQTFKIISNLIR